MKIKVLVALLCLCLALFALASCGECKAHVDANDDFMCDNCEAEFDDGYEPVTLNITITVDGGMSPEGKKLVLVDGDLRYEITLDSAGKACELIIPGIYEVSFEGYMLNADLVKIKPTTTTLELMAMDNTPDGALAKPFPVTTSTDLTIGAGEEIFFTYKGTSIKYARVYSDSVAINYNGTTYTAVDGLAEACIRPGFSHGDNDDGSRNIIFSVKTISDESVSVTLLFEAPLGSGENPYVMTEATATVTVNADTEVYYVWVADKDGTLTLTANTDRNNITVSKVMEGNVPKVITTKGKTEISLSVKAGDEIRIGVTAFAPTADGESQDVEIVFSLEIK